MQGFYILREKARGIYFLTIQSNNLEVPSQILKLEADILSQRPGPLVCRYVPAVSSVQGNDIDTITGLNSKFS